MNHQQLKQKLLANEKFKKAYQQPDIFLDIANSLQTLRIKKGLTQAALAKKVGMQQEAIARLENPGYSVKYLITLEKIAKALGTRLIAPKFKSLLAEKKQKTNSLQPAFFYRIFNSNSSTCDTPVSKIKQKIETASSYNNN